MRNCNIRCINGFIAIEKNIDIDDAGMVDTPSLRIVFRGIGPPHGTLDLLDGPQQRTAAFLRRPLRAVYPEQGGRIEELPAGETDGAGLDKP